MEGRTPSCSGTSRAAVVGGLEARVLCFRDVAQVGTHHATGVASACHFAVAQPEGLVAHLLDEAEAVGDDHDGAAPATEIAYLVEALAREGLVAHGEDLVDEEDVGLGMDGHGEAEARVHPGGVVLHRSVDEVPELGEVDDVVEAFRHLTFGETEHDAVDGDVLAAGDLGVEAGSELDQGGDAPSHVEATSGGLGDSSEELQERRFARAVLANDAEEGALRESRNETPSRAANVWPGARSERRLPVSRALFSVRNWFWWTSRRSSSRDPGRRWRARSYALGEGVAEAIEEPCAKRKCDERDDAGGGEALPSGRRHRRRASAGSETRTWAMGLSRRALRRGPSVVP